MLDTPVPTKMDLKFSTESLGVPGPSFEGVSVPVVSRRSDLGAHHLDTLTQRGYGVLTCRWSHVAVGPFQCQCVEKLLRLTSHPIGVVSAPPLRRTPVPPGWGLGHTGPPLCIPVSSNECLNF